MVDITIQSGDPASPEVSCLLQQLDWYLTSLYPAESNHILTVEALRRPNVTFLIACANGRMAGCGSYVNQGDYAEIKRMFVLPEFRGMQIGRKLLHELEARARAAQLTSALLETGISQPEALRLYEKAGYRKRGPFGSYPDDRLSVFMEKRLN
jgi:putative acetyltransferase